MELGAHLMRIKVPGLALSTKAAIYSGIMANEVPQLPLSCETANCSWPKIPTLAACGECTPLNYTTSCDETTQLCTYTTASGTSFDSPINSFDHSIFKVSPSNGTQHPINSSHQAYFSVFETLYLTQAENESPEVSAYECAAWFCVHSYLVNVTEGRPYQFLYGNWSNTSVSFPSSSHGAEYVFVAIPEDFNAATGATYAVSYEAMSALRTFMKATMSGTVIIEPAMVDYSSDWAEAIWNSSSSEGGLSSWISTFVLSMSSEIRQRGIIHSPQTKQYSGCALQLAPFIRVQWLWTVYPGALILLSLWFLCYTIWASTHDEVSVWKSGALPMLFCRVDANIHTKVKDGMDIPDGLDERIGHTHVALRHGEDGVWGFRSTSEDEDEIPTGAGQVGNRG